MKDQMGVGMQTRGDVELNFGEAPDGAFWIAILEFPQEAPTH